MMKKAISLFLVAVLCFLCVGCNATEQSKDIYDYEQYDDLIALLENGDYEGAKTWISDCYGSAVTEAIDVIDYSVSEETFAATVPVETNASTTGEPETIEIELTPENFLDYFECILTECRFRENAFGEVEMVICDQIITLKEEYESRVAYGNGIAAELSWHSIYAYGDIDYENKKFIPNGKEVPFPAKQTSVFEFIGNENYALCSEPSPCVYGAPEAGALTCICVDEVLRAKGILVLFDNPEGSSIAKG